MKRLVLLKPGVTSSRERLGDYELWFAHGTGGLATFDVVELFSGAPVPALDGYDGVVVSGSPLSLTEPTEWMERAAERVVSAGQKGVPVLGVCFGHQLLAHGLGTKVVRNPLGKELGTREVTLTEAGQLDPLFVGAGARLVVQQTHEDMVGEVPRGATLLATNDACLVQAFAHGTMRGVQFHPEMNAASIRATIEKSGAPDAHAVAARAHDSLDGARLLQNFVTRLCR
jgi:GMP synthase (glutamine-hydrolysing)